MPIFGRTPAECFRPFTDHVSALVAATVTRRYPILGIGERGGDRMIVSFRQEGPVAVPITTSVGRLYFYLGQALEAVPEEGRFRLRTRKYWYRLQEAPELTEQATLRWEYDSETPSNAHCRHHIQAPIDLELGAGWLFMDRAHIPTGWVTMEEIIRFLIRDLEVRPPCGSDWPDVLAKSEKRFFEEFTSKRYRPPA